MEVAAGKTGPTAGVEGDPRSGPTDVAGEHTVGRTSDPWRAFEAWLFHLPGRRLEIHGPLPIAAIAVVADIPYKSRRLPGVDRFLRGPHGHVPPPVRIHRAPPYPKPLISLILMPILRARICAIYPGVTSFAQRPAERRDPGGATTDSLRWRKSPGAVSVVRQDRLSCRPQARVQGRTVRPVSSSTVEAPAYSLPHGSVPRPGWATVISPDCRASQVMAVRK